MFISHLEDPWATKDRAALIPKQLSRYAYGFAESTLINRNRDAWRHHFRFARQSSRNGRGRQVGAAKHRVDARIRANRRRSVESQCRTIAPSREVKSAERVVGPAPNLGDRHRSRYVHGLLWVFLIPDPAATTNVPAIHLAPLEAKH